MFCFGYYRILAQLTWEKMQKRNLQQVKWEQR